MLLTNDGELANRMMRARGLRQEYLCKIDGALSAAEIRDAEQRGHAKLQRAKGMPAGWWEVKTSSASNDEFRKALIAAGHHVDKLRRIAIGNIELGALRLGEYRHISREEIAELEDRIAKAEKRMASSHPIAHEDGKRGSQRRRVSK